MRPLYANTTYVTPAGDCKRLLPRATDICLHGACSVQQLCSGLREAYVYVAEKAFEIGGKDRTRRKSCCICGHSRHAMHSLLLLVVLLLALGGAAAAQSAVTRARADLREPFRRLRSCLPVTVFVAPPVAGAPRPGSVLQARAGAGGHSGRRPVVMPVTHGCLSDRCRAAGGATVAARHRRSHLLRAAGCRNWCAAVPHVHDSACLRC